MIYRLWLTVEKRPTSEPIGIVKTLNVRQRHIHTFLNAINTKTLDPRRVGLFSPAAPLVKTLRTHVQPSKRIRPPLVKTANLALQSLEHTLSLRGSNKPYRNGLFCS